jgi:hypothetical protein
VVIEMSERTISTPRPRITTLESLRAHLQWAIELEHATLPSYLCALYSLDPDHNPEAAEVLGSVFVEEMLHLALAANLANAIGGRPQLDIPRMLPGYPRPLPHSDGSIELSLLPFGVEAVELFARVEQPASPTAPDQCDGYSTISQFYEAIGHGLVDLCDRLGDAPVFCGDPERQVTADHLAYGGSGRIFAVEGLPTALAALDEIVSQGEGAARSEVWDGDREMFHPDRDEVGHHYRFRQLLLGRWYQAGDTPTSGPTGSTFTVDWDAVRPMRRNPRLADHGPGTPVRVAQEAFNQDYCSLLQQLDDAFNGHPQLLAGAVGTMYGLKAQAEHLLQTPIGGGQTAGPTFEYVDRELRR